MLNPEITRNLEEAYDHLHEALRISIESVLADKSLKTPIGEAWEQFLGRFFRMIRAEGKEHKLNLLSLISFQKVWK
ncbi:MAG: hypothetical protein JWN30_1228 [Bacilli bacterium]|nr:hypothetical protein [Bacilli bacterium]